MTDSSEPKKKKKPPPRQVHRVRVPTVLQMEAVECGAACLSMILAYWGRWVSLEKMRVDCNVSRDGSKAKNIIEAAKLHGMNAHGVRQDPEHIGWVKMPCVVFWNFDHYVVLEGFNDKWFWLNDPARGPRRVTAAEFDKSFTGVAMEFTPGDDFQKQGHEPSVLRPLVSRLKGLWGGLLLAIMVGLLLVIPELAIPGFAEIYIDGILINERISWMKALVLGLLGTAVVRGILSFVKGYVLLRVGVKLDVNMSMQFIRHIMRLPSVFFSQRYIGDIVSRLQSNTAVSKLAAGRLATSLIDIMTVLFFIPVMLIYDWKLTLVAVMSTSALLLLLKLFSRIRTDQARRQQQQFGKSYGVLMAGVRNIETLKSNGREDDFFSLWAGYEAISVNARQGLSRSTMTLNSLSSMVQTSIVSVVILTFGGLAVMNGEMTVGALVAFQSLTSSFIRPIKRLVGLGSSLQTIKADIARIDDVLDYEEDPLTEDKVTSEEWLAARDNKKPKGQLELRNLTFGFNRVDEPFIKDFNLTLKPGGWVALVGASGSGKSTLGNLICGLAQPMSGEILVDGEPLDSIPRDVRAMTISKVDQNISLFEGTVRDNITLWDSTVPMHLVQEAARDAEIEDEIQDIPGAYRGWLIEGGGNLSGGQRQRLEIARAMLPSPSILILDEATSALDTLTEEKIGLNLRRRACSCVVVAHRLSTIRDADEIIVLEHGKVVERGDHESLMANEGPYAELVKQG